jgi:hypothetical protein
LAGAARKSASEANNLRSLQPSDLAVRLEQFAGENPQWSEMSKRYLEQRKSRGAPAHMDGDTGGQGRRARVLMLTWNGAWGMIQPADLFPEVRALVDLAGGRNAGAIVVGKATYSDGVPNGSFPIAMADPEFEAKAMTEMGRSVGALPMVRALATEFQECLRGACECKYVRHWVWSLELCTRTLTASKEVRLHFHACVDLQGKLRTQQMLERLVFRGSTPVPSKMTSLGAVDGKRRRSADAGFYYVQAPKVGKVASGGTQQPFLDYAVNPLWVSTLCEGDKMLYRDARLAMARAPVNIRNNLANLDKWYQERCAAQMQECLRWHRLHLATLQKPWKRYALVDLWLSQYVSPAPRFRFLVIDGPSLLGKTAFARSLAPPGCSLELNMAGGKDPDLRTYDAMRHDVLIWDECAPAQVLANRKLFQACAASIQLGTSSTNVYAFEVYCGGKKFVVSSNVWCESLKGCAPGDADWLTANSYVLKVLDKMWIDHPERDLPLGRASAAAGA